MDKDDSMYHGKSSRNRVDGSHESIIRTRSASRSTSNNSVAPLAKRRVHFSAGSPSPVVPKVEETDVSLDPVPPHVDVVSASKKRPSKKATIKSPVYVVDSDDDAPSLTPPPVSQAVTPPVTPKARKRSSSRLGPPIVLSSDEDVPLAESLTKRRRLTSTKPSSVRRTKSSASTSLAGSVEDAYMRQPEDDASLLSGGDGELTDVGSDHALPVDHDDPFTERRPVLSDDDGEAISDMPASQLKTSALADARALSARNKAPVKPSLTRPPSPDAAVKSEGVKVPDDVGGDVTFAQLLGLPSAPERDNPSNSDDESSGGLVLEDLQFYRVKSLPRVCQVTHRDLQDPLLKKYYDMSLPPLRRTNNMKKKLLTGVLHSQEWERFVGFICTAFGQLELDAQLFKDAIEFSTRPEAPQGGASGSGDSMFTNQGSPMVKLKRSATQSFSDVYSLGCDASIPVYDCRRVPVNFNTDLDKLDSFPRWDREIPRNSFVVVAHTITVFKSGRGNWSLSLNIMLPMSKGSAERPVSRSVPDALRGPKSTRSSKYFGWKDLAPYAVDNCDSFVASRYEFVQYLHVDALPLFLKANPRCVALKLPLGVLASKLTVRELVTLARIHRVSLDRGESKGSMLSKFCSHLCTDCDSFRAVFLSCALTRQSLKETLKLEPVEKIARRVRPFAFSRLLQFCTPAPEHLAAFVDGARFASLELIADGCSVPYSTPDLLVVSPAPWYFLALHGSRPVHLYLAKLHGLSLPSRCSRSEAIKLLSDHSCVDCSSFYAVFRPINLSDAVDDFSMGPATICGNDKVHKYPPSPIAADETMDIIRDFCRNLEPSNFEEAGCAVCGQLTLLSLLSPLSSVDFSLDPLIEPGLARKERMTSSDPVQYADGPILADGCSSICDLCSVSLRKGRRPVVSLANGAWVGGVPSELSDLTYAEQCLIARVRCNRYVVRVSFGQSKLIANAISFPAPTLKVYSHLPPPRAELEEVLAVIFTGVKPPTEEDLERTPLLVRRNKVSSALEWLKLNHSDYADLCIDLDALNSYPDGGVPVKVVHKTMLEDSNVVVSATSIHETEDETGTSEGPCPFTVHELVGSNLTNMTTSGRKAAALRHLQSGGSVLAVGHSDVPESMYNNPGLYPQIYPWLFPYGLGGVGNPRLQGLVSESRHKKLLLTYYDKRFQYDSRFVLMAFNHEQLKAGTTSSFILTKRSNFSDVVRKVSQVNPAVLKHIANRLEAGERVTPSTDDEKLCFSILDQVEHVGGAVHGSLAGKKRMRAELWSLISYIGAPSWFVTISPVDSKHPLCLYWADKDLKFDLNLRDYNQRARLIAANPVAGARFFHFLVQLFIRHLLKWADNSDGKGIFGHTSAYYGTVEQQGRMTLHLHMLIWISGAWSPQTVRERLMSDDSEFTAELISYLEGCQVGEFFTGTMEDMKQRHSTDGDSSARDYDPTQHFPVPPPTTDCLDYTCCTCGNCVAVKDWYSKYQLTVDDIVYRSNVHRCFAKKDIVLDGVRKQHLTGKGCINKDGVCTARFPREVHEESTVDSDGRISLKKLEPMINTINPVVTYCFGCNTDVTCLSSGTAVNATTGYVADYIVKMGVKSHQIFSSIYDVFERNTDVWSESKSNEDAARKLILKMANSLTSKVEIGGPMAAMYLLGNPDHYTSHIFVPFYWKPYVSDVLRCWEVSQCSVLHQGVQAGADIVSHSYASPDKVEPHGSSECDEERTDDNDLEEDRVLIARQGKKFVSRSSIDDYKLRPAELDHVCLYDWVQCGVRKSLAEIKGKSTSFLLYAQGHPLRSTHVVVWDINRKHSTVPCVLGPYLPRRDAEDRDFYCCTMLTFFVPWRTGLDLRSPEETWSQRFDGLSLEARYQNIVNNMNVRYECYDARDDFHSQIKARLAAQVAADNDDADDPGEPECSVEVTDCPDSVDGLNENLGQWTRSMMGQMSDVEGMLHKAGWNTGTTDGSDSSSSSVAFCPERSLPPSRWKDIVDAERSKLLNARLDSVAGAGQLADDMENEMRCRNDARIIPGSYLLSSFTTMDGDVESHLERIRGTFGLNTEQKRAFNVVAHHSLSVSPEPLRMYIGGMGGTGKTQVIKALLKWFEERGEPHRMAVLAPTGAAASIIRGSTYHSFLGVRTGKKKGRGEPSVYSLEDARLRLTGVDYIFLDEISMVSCQEFYLIDARLKELCKKFDVAFGGLSMIVAGDFAQLPPAGGLSLYSGKVSAVLLARQDQEELENTLERTCVRETCLTKT
ncbi:hypothetical protein MD484_g4135, partial [Candolleomyces efflorescens]